MGLSTTVNALILQFGNLVQVFNNNIIHLFSYKVQFIHILIQKKLWWLIDWLKNRGNVYVIDVHQADRSSQMIGNKLQSILYGKNHKSDTFTPGYIEKSHTSEPQACKMF